MAAASTEYGNTRKMSMLTSDGDILYKYFDGLILLEGWLKKSPPENQYKHENRWKRRYFLLLKLNEHHYRKDSPLRRNNIDKKGRKANELSEYTLAYWENKDERENGSKPIRAIPLENCDIEDHRHPFWQVKFPHMISLKTSEGRNYFLCPDSEELKTLWLDTMKQAIPDPIYDSIDKPYEIRRPSETTCRTWTGDSGYSSRPHSTLICDQQLVGRCFSDTTNSGVNVKRSINHRHCVSTPNLSELNFEDPIEIYAEFNAGDYIAQEQQNCLQKFELKKGILKPAQRYDSADNIYLSQRAFSSPARSFPNNTTDSTELKTRSKSVHFDKPNKPPRNFESYPGNILPPMATSSINENNVVSNYILMKPCVSSTKIKNNTATKTEANINSGTPNNVTANDSKNDLTNYNLHKMNLPINNSTVSIIHNDTINCSIYDIPKCEISTIKRVSIGDLVVELPSSGQISYQNDKVVILSNNQVATFQVRQMDVE